MTTLLPPNVFDSGAVTACVPDEAAASDSSRSPVAAADIPDGSAQLDSRAASQFISGNLEPDPSGTDCIGEIFIGAAKLEPVEMWFENTAYPHEDELLYEVLLAMDDPHAPDLIEMPYGMEGIFDPPPLFLQRTA